jgi:hypothetical protein
MTLRPYEYDGYGKRVRSNFGVEGILHRQYPNGDFEIFFEHGTFNETRGFSNEKRKEWTILEDKHGA